MSRGGRKYAYIMREAHHTQLVTALMMIRELVSTGRGITNPLSQKCAHWKSVLYDRG